MTRSDRSHSDNDFPSVSNLRVGGLQRRATLSCFLNVFLLVALILAILAILYLLAAPYIFPRAITPTIVVETTCGTVKGIEQHGLGVFLGIPYALPPTKDRRFKRPVELHTPERCHQAWVPSEAWKATGDQWNGLGEKVLRNATEYKPPCLQLVPRTDELIGSEDCLYLNIYVPPNTKRLKTPKPVVIVISGLFFVYGGTNGLPVSAVQRPHPLTVKAVDAIHVTLNYRIGPMGFLVHPVHQQPNLGLYDQLAALRWVRNNIDAFGGDPTRVTLFGYGSGSTSLMAVSSSHLGQNLYDGLWISAPSLGRPRTTLKMAIKRSAPLFNCTFDSEKDTYSCPNDEHIQVEDIVRQWNWTVVKSWMRHNIVNLPSKLIEKDHNGQMGSMIESILVEDGSIVDGSKWYKPVYTVPSIVGQTSHETSLYMEPATTAFWSETDYREYVARMLANDNATTQQTVRDHIDSTRSFTGCMASTDNNSKNNMSFDVQGHLSSLITDARCTCPLLQLTEQMSHKKVPLYYYYLQGLHRRFDPYALTSFVSHAFHGWDGMLYFRAYLTHPDYLAATESTGGKNEQANLERVSNFLTTAMHEFSRTGRIKSWHMTEPTRPNVNVIDTNNICTVIHFDKLRCDVWRLLTGGDLTKLAWQN